MRKRFGASFVSARRITLLILTLLKRMLAVGGLLAISAGATYAQGDSTQLPAFTSEVSSVLAFLFVASIAAILYGFVLRA